FMHSQWLRRFTASNGDWQGAALHDGISIDVSFTLPGVDTKTWWERQPSTDKQAWGTGASTYMSLEAGKLFIGAERVQSTHTHANALVQIGGKMACKELVVLDNTK